MAADDEAEAIAAVEGGEAKLFDGPELVGIGDAYGMPLEHLDPKTIEKLHELGYSLKQDYLEGIRRVEEVSDE